MKKFFNQPLPEFSSETTEQKITILDYVSPVVCDCSPCVPVGPQAEIGTPLTLYIASTEDDACWLGGQCALDVDTTKVMFGVQEVLV